MLLPKPIANVHNFTLAVTTTEFSKNGNSCLNENTACRGGGLRNNTSMEQ